jgi:phage shock protein PspC (stress-responsive transcriptional regulator)
MSVQHAPVQESYVALPLREHTIFGVCEGIGADFGFNPIFLRVPLAAGVLWSPIWAIGTYLALGVLVLASRLLFPRPTSLSANVAPVATHDNDGVRPNREPVQIAA